MDGRSSNMTSASAAAVTRRAAGRIARAPTRSPPGAGARFLDRVSDHLDARGGGAGRNGDDHARGRQADRRQDRHTSDGKDVWFVGFSPDLVVGLYLGYDKPRTLGRAAQGGRIAAPIAKDFMKLALADKPPTPFKVPPGIRLVRVDAKSGMRPGPGEGGRTVLEAFKPGTAPPENYLPVSVAEGDGRVPPGSRPTPAISCVQEPAGFTSGRLRIALWDAGRYIRRTPSNSGPDRRQKRPCAPKSNAL